MCHTCKNHDNIVFVTIVYKFLIGRSSTSLKNCFNSTFNKLDCGIAERNCIIADKNFAKIACIQLLTAKAEFIAGNSAGTLCVLKGFEPYTVDCPFCRSAALRNSADSILF